MKVEVLTIAAHFARGRKSARLSGRDILNQAEGAGAVSTEIVTVANYFVLGEKVAQWAKGKLPWPTTILELGAALGDSVGIPERYTKLHVVQGNHDTLVLHLPEAQPLREAEALAEARPDSSTYPLPDFYDMESLPGIEMFHARIGDYCMAQCK